MRKVLNRAVRALSAALLACSPLCLAGEPDTDETPLRVMLQGDPGTKSGNKSGTTSATDTSAQLAELVTDQGGTVTHDLHIINAVGALLTPAQLDAVLESPLVTRHIDDLSLSPPEPEQEACNVGGALELDISGSELRWRLYNKGSDPVVLEELHLQWPERLGRLLSVQFGGINIGPQQEAPPGEEALIIRAPEAADTRIVDQALLSLHFSGPPPQARPLQQRELALEARFSGGCDSKLIPGYRRYGEDSYFPTVAGAASLHQLGITGRGVTVAVLDSGLWEHDSLKLDTRGSNRIRGRYDAIHDRSGEEVFDESGHGTHMTSVLAHSGAVTRKGAPAGSYRGMAPDAAIVVVKAFNETGQGDFLDIVRGVQWVVDHREALDIRVLNLSFAAQPRWPYWLDPINQAVMRAWEAGITVVAAAGNEGPEAMTVGSPGNLPYIITVGAVTDSWTPGTRNDDYIPDFSSRGPTPSAHIKPDIVAPGGHIAGITRPGSTLSREHPDYLLSTGEFVMTGTSQASAVVSGIVALLLQLEPGLSPDDVKCKLVSSAELAINRDGRLAYSPFQQGNGYVNASRAVTLGQRHCGNPDMELELDIADTRHYQGPAILTEDSPPTLPGLSELYDGSPSAKGASDSRRWGVKAHIERREPPAPAGTSPVDWMQQYLQEKATIDSLLNSGRTTSTPP